MNKATIFFIGLCVAALISCVMAFTWKEKPILLNDGAYIKVYQCSNNYMVKQYGEKYLGKGGLWDLKTKSIYVCNLVAIGHEISHAADNLYLGDWWEAARNCDTPKFKIYLSENDLEAVKEKKLILPRHSPTYPTE